MTAVTRILKKRHFAPSVAPVHVLLRFHGCRSVRQQMQLIESSLSRSRPGAGTGFGDDGGKSATKYGWSASFAARRVSASSVDTE